MTDVDSVIEAMVEAQGQVRFGQAVAVAVGGAGRWMSPHYWQDEVQREAFETLVATECVDQEDRVVVFVTPVLVTKAEQRLDFRSPREEQRDGEHFQLFGLAIDADNGFDVLRCNITEADGVTSFGDIEMFEGNLRLTPETPGFTLLQGLLAA